MRMDKGNQFMDVESDYPPKGWEQGKNPPTFSEAFLYDAVGKGDARFILGVAEEYEHVIKALGPKAVRRILAVNPRLAQRLKLGHKVNKWLKDAMSDSDLMYEERRPSQVIIDIDGARDLWQQLHYEYRTQFNPEESMDSSQLRAYNTLTEALGHDAIEERQKERDRLPEKLVQQEERRKVIAERRAQRRDNVGRIDKALTDYVTLDQDRDSAARAVERELRKELTTA